MKNKIDYQKQAIELLCTNCEKRYDYKTMEDITQEYYKAELRYINAINKSWYSYTNKYDKEEYDARKEFDKIKNRVFIYNN